MRSPDFSKPFILQTDASGIGIGAVLSQSEDCPIAYYSRKLLDRERKYATVEQECLAIFAGIRAFETYLIGKPFVLQTDHRALQWLQKSKDGNARLLRWSLLLQPYNFTVQHRKGTQNGNADALSRLPICSALEKGEGIVEDHLEDQFEDHYETDIRFEKGRIHQSE
jgi:phospholipid-translocating ATPase